MGPEFEQFVFYGFGAVSGLIVGLVAIIVCGLCGVSRSADGTRLYSSGFIAEGLSSLKSRPGRIVMLFGLITALYAMTTMISAFLGVPMGFIDALIGAALIFLGHRFLLEQSARTAGLAVPDKGFVGVLVRSILLGLIVLTVLGIIGLGVMLTGAVLGSLGLAGAATDGLLGFLGGLAIAALTLFLSRLTFLFPAAALGGKTWITTAGEQSQGASWALAGALWAVFVVSAILAIILIVALGFLRAALGLPTPMSDYMLHPDDPALIWELVFIDLPAILATTAYSIVSISVVSAAYRQLVLAPAAASSDDLET